MRSLAPALATSGFLAGNTADLAEVASDPSAQAIRSSYSTTFNAAIQDVLAGHAANGVIVHYLDLETVGDLIMANPQAYGFTSTSPCAPVPPCVTDSNYANNFLFYVDGLHLTSAGFGVIGQYIATQLQAPLTLEAPSELGLDTARQFGRTLNSRVDLGSPRDGDVAEGLKVFLVGDSFSRDAKPSDSIRRVRHRRRRRHGRRGIWLRHGHRRHCRQLFAPARQVRRQCLPRRGRQLPDRRLRRLRDRRGLRPGLSRLRLGRS